MTALTNTGHRDSVPGGLLGPSRGPSSDSGDRKGRWYQEVQRWPDSAKDVVRRSRLGTTLRLIAT
jgi:hypothetical protein